MNEGVKKQDIICILCPKGCALTVTGAPKDDGSNVEGANCKEGVKYAFQEGTDPRRLVCTSVEVKGGDLPLLSVRTARAIPKKLVRECLGKLSGIAVSAPVRMGQVIISDVLGTGIDVIATREVGTL